MSRANYNRNYEQHRGFKTMRNVMFTLHKLMCNYTMRKGEPGVTLRVVDPEIWAYTIRFYCVTERMENERL